VPDQALTEPLIEPAASHRRPASSDHFLDRFGSAGRLVKAYPWWFTAAGLVIFSAILVRVLNTRPGYDPYGWMLWGKLTIHGKLDTNGAPSWKPLPFLFTVPYALLGHLQLWLWMTTAVAVSLSGGIFAWRIAWFLVDAPPEKRYAGYAAGAFAVGGVLGIVDYGHYVFSAQSDSMIVALCLGATDCWLRGHQRWALALFWLGALGRPEVWPFMLLHTVWCWRKDESMRRLIVAAWVAIPLLWYGIPGLTAHTPFISQDNALDSPRELHSGKIGGTIHRFDGQQTWSIEVVALLGFIYATTRRRDARNSVTILLGACVIAWVLIEVAFALHGFPAVPRYMFEPVAFTGVIAGITVGRGLLDAPELIRKIAPAVSLRAGTYVAAAVALVFALGLLPVAKARYDAERKDLRHERARTTQINRLAHVINVLSSGRILACGVPNPTIEYGSVLAWDMDIKTAGLLVTKENLIQRPRTLVDFYPLANGWHVFPAYVTAKTAPHCHGLRVLYTT
jgi:hypothetical protein